MTANLPLGQRSKPANAPYSVGPFVGPQPTSSWCTGKFFEHSRVGAWTANHTGRDDPPILTGPVNKRRTVVNRGFLVAVGGAAIVIAGLSGCSSDKKSETSERRRRRPPQQRARARSRSTARTRPCRARSSAARWARTSTSRSATPRPVSARSSARATARRSLGRPWQRQRRHARIPGERRPG